MIQAQSRALTGVIFDLDGTLVDSAPDICNALNAFLAERGRPGVTLGQTQAALGDGVVKLLERIHLLVGVQPQDAMAEVQAFVAIYRAIKADPAQIYPGVTAVLQHLRDKGVALGVCTNKPETATLKLLEDLALQRYFGAVAGGDTFLVHKPDPGHLRGVIERLGVDAAGCVMVGDSTNDLAAAHGMQTPCVLVDYGYGSDVSFLPAEAVIQDMAALPGALAQLGFRF